MDCLEIKNRNTIACKLSSTWPTDPSDYGKSAPKLIIVIIIELLYFAIIYPVYEVTDTTKSTTIVNQLIDLALLVIFCGSLCLRGISVANFSKTSKEQNKIL